MNIANNLSERQINSIKMSIECILYYQSSYSIIKQAKEYFPTRGYIRDNESQASWLDNNIIKFSTAGWQYNEVKYQYRE